jgi:hypothetical protein
MLSGRRARQFAILGALLAQNLYQLHACGGGSLVALAMLASVAVAPPFSSSSNFARRKQGTQITSAP